MDLNFIIFPAPSSSYKVDSFKPVKFIIFKYILNYIFKFYIILGRITMDT